jgi:hypothetical protein
MFGNCATMRINCDVYALGWACTCSQFSNVRALEALLAATAPAIPCVPARTVAVQQGVFVPGVGAIPDPNFPGLTMHHARSGWAVRLAP